MATRSPGIAQLREAVRARLSEPGAGHCERVAQIARALAMRNHVDPDAAETAGLLHDWDRDATPDGLLRAAHAAGVEVLPVESREPYLLHARMARLDLERTFPGISSDVLDAVETHTVGAPEMTALQKIVFVADMIEPERAFDGVDSLRDCALHLSIDECFRTAYALSVANVVASRLPLHPMTVEVWNTHVAEVRP